MFMCVYLQTVTASSHNCALGSNTLVGTSREVPRGSFCGAKGALVQALCVHAGSGGWCECTYKCTRTLIGLHVSACFEMKKTAIRNLVCYDLL